MTTQLFELGLLFERIPAIDGKELSCHDYEAAVDLNNLGPNSISYTQAGCFLSHRKVWECIAKGSDNYAVIMEDDILISKSAPNLLTDEGWIPTHSGFIKLCTPNCKVRLNQPYISSKKISGVEFLFYELGIGIKARFGAYVIHREMAIYLTNRFRKISQPIDVEVFSPSLFYNKSANIPNFSLMFQLCPAIAIQQMDYKTRFLPKGARVSQIHRLKPSIPSKLVREAKRLVGKNHWRKFFTYKENLPFLE